MVDFRKAMLLLVVLVAMTGVASAQFFNPLQCVANAGVPPIARAEGVAEEVGQVVIVCTGGTPTLFGQPIPTVNVQIFLNTNVTSRLFTSPVTNASEALLLIDEPAPTQPQLLCPAGTLCPITSALGNGTGNYTGVAGRQNVFQAVQAGSNSVVWLGVPVDPPGTTGNRVLRLVNVRANANQLGVSSTLIPTSINMFISISGTGSLALTNPQLTVAYVQPGMTFSASTANYNQCEPQNWTPYYIRYKERFATAFRANPSPAILNQNVPGTIYNTESMFSNSTTTAAPANAGVATQATRLIARFTNVPANVRLRVQWQTDSTSYSGILPIDGAAQYVTSPDSAGAGGTVTSGAGTTELTISGGAAMAVWEVISANVGVIGEQQFRVEVNYTANPLPGLGTATVAGNYAPVTTVFTASTTAPVPRFVENPQSATTFTINPCQTNLLFPYVTNAPGFDTGVAISNTSTDPYGTVPQSGPCQVWYYGSTTGGGAAPPSQTSGTVNSGSQLVFTLSGGGNLGIAATPGFTGYMIARCNFQFAHGYAFISDIGIRNWAQGYIALVLDTDMFSASTSRTGVKSEKLVH